MLCYLSLLFTEISSWLVGRFEAIRCADWATTWAFIQAIGVPGSLFFAIYIPKAHAKSDQMKQLIANRNIAFTCQRLTETLLTRPYHEISGCELDLEVCLTSLSTVTLAHIWPSKLVEQFIEIQHMALRAQKYLKDPSALDALTIKDTIKRNSAALDAIDNEIKINRGTINETTGYAEVPKPFWRGSRS